MQIAREMCGFSGGQADTLRKAIGKKKADLMAKMKVEFIDGMVEHSGVQREFAENYWDKLEGFADYCFNKSHSACYAMIAYQTAYLKANYTAAFMAALMTSDYEDTDRIAIEIAECRHMGIPVLPPDVNESYVEFAVRPTGDPGGDEGIRFGLSAIKNVGVGAVEEILRARDDGGPFASVEDFAKRVSVTAVNRKAWESLIKSGAFDNLGDRATLLHNLEKIISFAQKIQKEAKNGQADLFGDAVVEESLLPKLDLETPREEVSTRESLQWERQLLGVYISHHPLDSLDAYLRRTATPLEQITTDSDGSAVTIGGLLTDVREITTKNGAKMAFVKIEDKTGELELIVFPKAYSEDPELWQVDKVVSVQGKVNTKDRDGNAGQELKILVDTAGEISEEDASDADGPPDTGDSGPPDPEKKESPAPEQKHRAAAESAPAPEPGTPGSGVLEITIPATCGQETLVAIKQLLNKHDGQSEAVIRLDNTRIKLPFHIGVNKDLLDSLHELDNVEASVQ